MPSRWVCVFILVFWLACNGWLFYHDLLPRLVPGQPPPYTIDLVEEADTVRPVINWDVYHNGEKVFRAKTSVSHPAHDVFELSAEYRPAREGSTVMDAAIWAWGSPHTNVADCSLALWVARSTFIARESKGVQIGWFLVEKMSSKCRVTAVGDLLGLDVRVEGSLQLADIARTLFGVNLKLDRLPCTLEINGEVNGDRFAPTATLVASGLTPRKYQFPETTLRRGNSVLQPLHPVNRIQGLVPGQRWQMTVFDPLQDSLAALTGIVDHAEILRVRVLPQKEDFSHGRREAKCHVIEYRGENLSARTYVDVKREQVLCQDVTQGKDHWVMYRD